MIFYLIPEGNGQPRELAGTQADARALCKQHGLKFNADQMQHDVPTSKWELMNYVNNLLAPSGPLVIEEMDDHGQPVEEPMAPVAPGQRHDETYMQAQDRRAREIMTPPDTPLPTAEAIAAKVSAYKATEIEDFILYHATVAQVENIFSCLGNRFAEARKS